jgi:hypothetical protein
MLLGFQSIGLGQVYLVLTPEQRIEVLKKVRGRRGTARKERQSCGNDNLEWQSAPCFRISDSSRTGCQDELVSCLVRGKGVPPIGPEFPFSP